MASTKFSSKKNLETLLANMKKGRSDLIRWSEEDKAAEDKATEVITAATAVTEKNERTGEDVSVDMNRKRKHDGEYIIYFYHQHLFFIACHICFSLTLNVCLY